MGDKEYDPFLELVEQNNAYARPRNIATLTPGVAYKVVHFTQSRSLFRDNASGQYPQNTIVHYFENEMKFQSILPKKYNDKEPRWIEAMNNLIGKGIGCKLVFYGTLNKANEVDLLRHTQDVDVKRLETVQGIMSKMKAAEGSVTPTKRVNSDLDYDAPLQSADSDVSGTPTKRAKSDVTESPA